MIIEEENSSNSLGYIYISIPPHIDIHSKPGRITTFSLETTTQIDSMDFRLKWIIPGIKIRRWSLVKGNERGWKYLCLLMTHKGIEYHVVTWIIEINMCVIHGKWLPMINGMILVLSPSINSNFEFNTCLSKF